jgi:hypothetical protein
MARVYRKGRYIARKLATPWLWLSTVVVLSCCFALYVGSYYHLSRRGMEEAKPLNSFFFYVPMKEIGPDTPGLKRHYFLRRLYDPINTVDRACFGGDSPCGGITWSLSR